MRMLRVSGIMRLAEVYGRWLQCRYCYIERNGGTLGVVAKHEGLAKDCHIRGSCLKRCQQLDYGKLRIHLASETYLDLQRFASLGPRDLVENCCIRESSFEV